MAFREEHPSELCSVCRVQTEVGCRRCRIPLCAEHMPAEDKCCGDCENEWIVRRAQAQLGTWGKSSNALFTAAKRLAKVGFIGLAATILLAVAGATGLAWIASLFILGLPLAVVPIALLPAARAAERARDQMESRDRRLFLEEGRVPQLPPSTDSRGPAG
ncbi:MAG: hypothetical protein KJO07_05405 [Deltaproteobacteria bacterium]|nr:hypothetical protein [Deltaproteobacteria bacterium]